MKIISSLLEDILLIESPAFEDHRGGFVKLFNQTATPLERYHIQQVNFVQNKAAYTLRGLHYQKGTAAESKFFRVMKGAIQLAIADLRPQSSTAFQGVTVVLNDPKIGVLVPKGCATGYLTLAPNTDVLYYSDNVYTPGTEGGIRWNDPHFKFDWQHQTPQLSEKDTLWDNFQPNSLQT